MLVERSARMIDIPHTDEALLAECDVDTFRSSGPGGQHVNKTETAVRLTHRPTGLVVVNRTERSQHRNKMRALARLRAALARLNHRPTPRVPTRPTRAAKERTRQAKARRA